MGNLSILYKLQCKLRTNNNLSDGYNFVKPYLNTPQWAHYTENRVNSVCYCEMLQEM